MKTTVAITLTLAAAASVARADVTLDVVAGTVHATTIEGTHAVDTVRTPDRRTTVIDISSGLPIRRISHSTAAVTVHVSAGGSAPLTTALFKAGVTDGTSNTVLFSELTTGRVTRPAAIRTIALDPADPGAELLDAGHVTLPGGVVRAWIYVRRSSGEAMLVDYDVAGGAVRRTPLGFTPPIGSNKGSLTALPSGAVWGVFSSPTTQTLVIYDCLITSVLAPVHKGTIVVGSAPVPESTHVGIIAILIGLLTQPTPAISYQVGDELVVAVPENGGFRTIARHRAPADAAGLTEEEGIFYYLLPYVEQDNVYKAYGSAFGQEPAALFTTGH